MASPEVWGVASTVLSGLVALVIALISVVYRNDQKVYDAFRAEVLARISALEKQNTEQETRIATLAADASHVQRDNNRLLTTLDNLDKTQNAILQELAQQRGVLSELSRRLTGQPMAATKLPTR